MSNRYMITTDLKHIVKWADDALLVPGAIGVIEYSAYLKLQAAYEELLSYLPKVPTEPHDKALAKEVHRLEKILNTPAFQVIRDLKEENERLQKDWERLNIKCGDYSLENEQLKNGMKMNTICTNLRLFFGEDKFEVLFGKVFETTEDGE